MHAFKLLILISLFFGLTACQSVKPVKLPKEPSPKEKNFSAVSVKIKGKTYQLHLANNDTTHAFIKRLPLELTLQELNGNEKFQELPFELPTDEQPIQQIRKGDVLLFGSRTLVIFYEDFPTHYKYTRIGKLAPHQVDSLKSNTSVQVKIARPK
ncbi:cyclophilin-like fold protein [Enterococcus sp. CSURQ0835]|uniref:cyclophilin-like fold protein n=1 Tax=Enterococcus sp. CSURQ0835 TaxID=2681394 RepID=UPI00135AD156|nr:cyclophilin-like fold protein [Enterococcus sp. CSURQ0835]